MIQRYSSRRSPLKDFLAARLQGAHRYDRIAGFFSSSLLEVAGEALERMTPVAGEACVRGEGMDFELLRRSLNINTSDHWASPEAFHKLRKPDLQRIKRLSRDFFPKHNPFIRRIVRRTRDFLENSIDPQANEPYLQRIEVRLFGESEAEAIGLPPFLRDAYAAAEEFCAILARRPGLNSGFMKTMLLRRVGSTIEAGRLTAMKMLETQPQGDQADEEGENEEEEKLSSLYPLSHEERAVTAWIGDCKSPQFSDTFGLKRMAGRKRRCFSGRGICAWRGSTAMRGEQEDLLAEGLFNA